MKSEFPAPMVPAEVDLRDFAFMPLDVVRLRDSGLTAKASGDEFRAAVLLWCASWHQVPAASLPDDDDELANICGYSRARREWSKISAGARRGWVKCSDGRLYHERVASKALDAWIEKLASAIGGATGNAKRWAVEIDTSGMRGQFLQAVLALRAIDPQSRTLRKKVVAVIAAPSPPESQGESPPESPPDRKGQGQGQGLEKQIQETPVHYHPPAGGQARADVDVVGDAQPTPAGAVCKALRRSGIADTNPGHPRLLMLLEAGATEAEFVGFAQAAIAKGSGFAWILGAVEGERSRAVSTAAALHRGRLPTKADARVAANIAVAQRFLERTAK